MNKLYISLPITGYDLTERKEYAEKMKEKLTPIFLEYELVTPFEVCPNSEEPYPRLMGRCIEALLECDAAYFCPGWEKSKGCLAEFEVARIYGKGIKNLDL